MAIPKSLKKQARRDFTQSRETTRRRKTWSFKCGDLVLLKREKTWGIVVGINPYRVMTAVGYFHVNPSQLQRIQPL